MSAEFECFDGKTVVGAFDRCIAIHRSTESLVDITMAMLDVLPFPLIAGFQRLSKAWIGRELIDQLLPLSNGNHRQEKGLNKLHVLLNATPVVATR